MLRKTNKKNYHEKQNMNYRKRYKAVKKSLGWTNQDVANKMGNNRNSVEISTAKNDENFPRWGRLFIETHEEMLRRAEIHFPKPNKKTD